MKKKRTIYAQLQAPSPVSFREIAQLHEFRDIKMHSLAKLYKDARKRIAAKKC